MTAWRRRFHTKKKIKIVFFKYYPVKESKSSKSMVLISSVLCTHFYCHFRFFHKILKALNPPKDWYFESSKSIFLSPNVFSSGAARADYEDFPPTRRAFPREIWLMSLTLIDIARYKSLIEQSCLCTIRYFDRPDSFCDLVTWSTTIVDDTFAFLLYICNIANL